jgi:PAS domain S-box-containing protein
MRKKAAQRHRIDLRQPFRVPSSGMHTLHLAHSTHVPSNAAAGESGALEISPTGRIIAADAVAARLFGFASAAELVDAPQEQIEDSYVDSVRRLQFRKALVAFGVAEGFENQIRRPDGSRVWIRESGRTVSAPSKEVSFETTVEDITSSRSSELSRQQAQKTEVMATLAAGVAHNFNNLLTVIKGYSELIIEQGGPSEVCRAQLEQIHLAAVRGAGLTRQLLAYSRQDIPYLRNVDLNAVLKDLETLLRFMVGKHIQVNLSLDDRLGCFQADSGQVVQIVMNLVANARDAIAREGMIFLQTRNYKASEPEARQLSIKPGRYIALTVEDTGNGIAPEDLARIFEPFFTTKEVGRGTGLGLATVVGLAEKFGAELFVESEPGVGTVFTLLFPRVEGAAASRSTGLLPVTAPATGMEGLTILVAEEDEAVRQFVSDVLRRKECTVLDAANAGEALLLAEHARNVDLLIADYSMRYMTGPELAARLRARYPGLKVLYISSPVIAGASFTEPALPKPFAGSELCDRVIEILSGDI